MDIKLNEHFEKLSQILNEIGERVEGNLICDVDSGNIVISRNLAKIKNLQHLSKNKNKICEIGVNAGHSLLLMLEQNPTAEYLLFDLNNHKYTNPCIEYIKSAYPNTKIKIIYGDSKFTINNFINNNVDEMNTYDLVHIDGGHGLQEVISDYESCKRVAADESIVIFDDYDYGNIQNFIDLKLKENEIQKIIDSELVETNLHYVYKYISYE
jgi:predicted O-methyltransferase YrrM